MFKNIRTVTQTDPSVLILNKGDKGELELERLPGHFLLESRAVSVISDIQFETEIHSADKQRKGSGILAPHDFLREKADYPSFSIVSAKPGAMIIAEASLRRDQVCCFKGNKFLGQVDKFHVDIRGSSEPTAFATVHQWGDEDEDMKGSITFFCTILVKEDDFSRVFRHLWLAEGGHRIVIAASVPCFQWGPEASFAEPDDQRHILVEASKYLSIGLQSITVRKDFPSAPFLR